MEVDEPWQALACCMEIARAVRAPDPAAYVSHFPVHQVSQRGPCLGVCLAQGGSAGGVRSQKCGRLASLQIPLVCLAGIPLRGPGYGCGWPCSVTWLSGAVSGARGTLEHSLEPRGPSPSCRPQDGSCNGLQHYAALGRDSIGAASVNLLPSDVPQDVYSGVAAQVGAASPARPHAQGLCPVNTWICRSPGPYHP